MTFWNGWSELLMRDRESENYKWYWHSPSNLSPILFLCSLFWPSFSLSSFFSPISFYLLSSCNCRIYKCKIGIRSSPNSGRDPGTFFFFSEKEGACFFSSVQFSCSVVSNSLQPHRLQHTRLSCSSPIPRAYSNHVHGVSDAIQTISSSVVPFSSHLQCFPASGSFQMSQLFASGGQSPGVSASASVLLMNSQDWFPFGWIGWVSWQSKGLSRVFFNTTVQKHQFFGAQLSL